VPSDGSLGLDYEERLRLLDTANGYRDDAVGVEALRGRESPDVDQWLLTNLDL